MVVRAKLHNITQNAKNNCYKYLNRNQILYHKKQHQIAFMTKKCHKWHFCDFKAKEVLSS